MLFKRVLYLDIFLAVPPRFVNKMRNATFVAGEDTQFTCVIQSAPNPKIRFEIFRIFKVNSKGPM